MATRKDWLACLFGLALLLTCDKVRAEEAPEHERQGGFVASEVHPSPVVGPEAKDEPVVIHATTREPSCPAGWTLEAGVCLP